MVTTKEYHRCSDTVSVANFWANSTGCPGEFHVAFKHFQNLKNLMMNILIEKLTFYCPVGYFFSWSLLKLLKWHNAHSYD